MKFSKRDYNVPNHFKAKSPTDSILTVGAEH